MPNHQCGHPYYLLGMVDCNCRAYSRKAKTDPCVDPLFLGLQPALFASTVSDCKAPVLEKFHDNSHPVFVRQELEQLTGEAMVPDSVISSNVLRQQNCLVHG